MTRVTSSVHMTWGVSIELRDEIRLNATLYLPEEMPEPSPVVFTLTPYIGQTYHDFAMYFAERGLPFLTVDVRGRGNSGGIFVPNINEAKDGYDVVEWIARQPYCNGKVAMWGGSYAGLDQWATAKEFPPHLASIVPVASPYPAVDFPMRNNILRPYVMQWLTLVAGRTSQDKLSSKNDAFWGKRFRRWFEAGRAFNEIDAFFGLPSATLQEWLSHPYQDAYWDAFNPTTEQYAKLTLPILTITGACDGDQLGALMHYKLHQQYGSAEDVAKHYLVIGPWDHAGTREPKLEFSGLRVGPESLIDLPCLHLDWYAWSMQGGPKPAFLKKRVAYYVMGSDVWRYADTLDEVTARHHTLFLDSNENATDIFHSGSLNSEAPMVSAPDHYVYDPRACNDADIEITVDFRSRTDQRMVHLHDGKQLVYHSSSFEEDVEVSGFFKFSAWLAIDQPDTDFLVSIYDLDIDGHSTMLTDDMIRARYRENHRTERLIKTTEPLLYEFERFTFVSYRIKRRNRLRLVLGPMNSIYQQKNYNGGGVVSEESVKDARIVTVRLYHDQEHPSALFVPIGASGSD